MSAALVHKELREHGWVTAAVLALDGLLLAALLANADDDGGRFIALTRFSSIGGFVTATILAGRLFVREYAARTQLWLEVLPVSRGRVLATKWVLGAGAQATLIALAWLTNLAWQCRTEVITLHDAARALVSCLAFSIACWSFAAMTALLGRYRFIAWCVLVLLAFAIEEVAKVPLSTIPLFGLVGDASAAARATPSTVGLLQAAVVTMTCLAGAFALAVPGAGATATLLSTRMTARERAFVIAALLVALVVLAEFKREPVKPPFVLANAARAASPQLVVLVQPAEGVDEVRARALANAIADDVESLTAALQLPPPPGIFVLPQPGLDRELVQRASLGDASGIVVGAAPEAAELDVRTAVLHALLADATLRRAEKEDRHALLDGLAAWWPLRDDPGGRSKQWHRAAVGGPVTQTVLQQWDTTAEQLGPCVAMAIAFAAVDTVVTRLGRADAETLLTTLFHKPHDDVRVLLEKSPAALLGAAGVGWRELARAVETVRLTMVTSRSAVDAKVTPQVSAERGRTLEARVSGADAWAVRAARLGPWERQPHDDLWLDVRGAQATVPLSLVQGEDVWVAIDVEDEALGCRIRAFSARLEVP